MIRIFAVLCAVLILGGCGGDVDNDPVTDSVGNYYSNPLLVTDFTVNSITTSSAKVSWKTNMLSVYRIDYWKSNATNIETIQDTSPNFTFDVALTGLTNSTDYKVKLYAKTGDGYLTEKESAFKTY